MEKSPAETRKTDSCFFSDEKCGLREEESYGNKRKERGVYAFYETVNSFVDLVIDCGCIFFGE